MIELQIQCFAPGELKGTINNVVIDDTAWKTRTDIQTDQGCTIGITLLNNSQKIEPAKLEAQPEEKAPDNTNSPKSLCLGCVNGWCPMKNNINSKININDCSGYTMSETSGLS